MSAPWIHTDDEIREILDSYRVIAVVGLSTNPARPSHGVARFLMGQGYRIVPVRPDTPEVLGETAYPDLRSIPKEIGVEIVDVFRRPEHVGPIVDEAIAIGAKVLWLQDGVVNEEAAQRAADAGLTVVMDRCMARDRGSLFG